MGDWGPYQYLAGHIANAQAATVRITLSTAVMISDKFAITAAHSPLDENNEVTENLTVQNLWGEVRNIVNVYYVVEEDFAVVELESPFENSYAAELAATAPEPGDRLFLVGNSSVVANSGIGWQVSFGEDYDRDEEDYIDVFRIPNWFGNSGGGVYNEQGKLVGINSVFFPGDDPSPWFKEDFNPSNGIEPRNNGWLMGAINIDFISNYLQQYGIKNIPIVASENNLPENKPDPIGKIPVRQSSLETIIDVSAEDRKSSVLLSDAGAQDFRDDVFAMGGSGTVIEDELILTVMHALDSRPELSVGYFDRVIDSNALTFRISFFSDLGLVKRNSKISSNVPAQHIAETPLNPLEEAYLIGSPRHYWLSDGGWKVSAAVALNSREVESGSYDSGGASGGAIFNLSSEIVGVIATGYGPVPSGAVPTLLDRQDPHATPYAPTIFDNQNLPITGSADFFFLKLLVSENSPNSMAATTNEFYNFGASESGYYIYEWGWHTHSNENSGYIRRYGVDGIVDRSFANKGLFETSLGSYNEQIKEVFVSEESITIFGEYTRDGVQNIFQARLTIDGQIDQSWGLNGFRFFDSESQQSLRAAKRSGDTFVLVGTQFSDSGLDTFVMKVDEAGLDEDFGNAGLSLIEIPNSSELSADIILREDGVYLLVNSDKFSEWDALIIKLNNSGRVDTSFGNDGIARADYKDDFNFGIKLLDSNEGLFVAGHTYYSADETPMLSKLSYDGLIDQNFGESGNLLLPAISSASLIMDAAYDGELVLLASTISALQANEGFGDVIMSDFRSSAIYRVSEDGELVDALISPDIVENSFATSLVGVDGNYRFFEAQQNEVGFSSRIVELSSLSDMLARQSLVSPKVMLPGQILVGTDKADSIRGFDVASEIYGMGGDDAIFPTAGQSGYQYSAGIYVDGGLGNDRVYGSQFDDTLIGGGGFDHLNGTDGDDKLYASLDGGELDGGNGEDVAILPYSITEFGMYSESTLYLLSNPSHIYSIYRVEEFKFTDWSGSAAQLKNALTLPEKDQLTVVLHPYLDFFISTSQDLDLHLTAGLAHNGITTLGVGNDYIDGGLGDDRLISGGGNDVIIGGRGDDTIDGGDGVDTAMFRSPYSEYNISRIGDGYSVAHIGSGDLDTLTNIERLEFFDHKIALDINGNAGKVAKILGAFLGSDGPKNRHYVTLGLEALDGGASFQDLLQSAMISVFGVNPTSIDLVSTFYKNLTGELAPQNILDTYTTLLDSKSLTPLSLASQVTDHSLNIQNIDLVGIATQGLEYA